MASRALSKKSNVWAFNLCTFFGLLGVHRFYLGKILASILTIFGWVAALSCLFTLKPLTSIGILGAMWFWWVIDWLVLARGQMLDGDELTVSWKPELGITAGFWKRLAARVIDWNIVLFATLAAFFLLALHDGKQMEFIDAFLSKKHDTYSDAMVAMVLPFLFLYHAIMSATPWQATVGKRAACIFIGKNDGSRMSIFRSLWRQLMYPVSWITLIGLPMAGFTKNNRALHDYLAGTYVIQGRPSDYEPPSRTFS